MALAETTRADLLAIARAAFEQALTGRAMPHHGAVDVEASGVFVTIHMAGELRGCLGTLELQESLGMEVARLAAVVGREDRRFEPIRTEEVTHTHIELSVLTPPEPLDTVEAIEVGRHGLIAEFSGRRGLLLPQVATEHDWDAATFVEYTCLKAGLRRDAWRYGARLWRFEAEVFGEPQA